ATLCAAPPPLPRPPATPGGGGSTAAGWSSPPPGAAAAGPERLALASPLPSGLRPPATSKTFSACRRSRMWEGMLPSRSPCRERSRPSALGPRTINEVVEHPALHQRSILRTVIQQPSDNGIENIH